MLRIILISGADPGFQVRGGALKKIAKFVWAFRMKNHDFTPKNHIFSNFRGRVRRVRPPPPWIYSFCYKVIGVTENFTSQ
jgi:hypothetical protein